MITGYFQISIGIASIIIGRIVIFGIKLDNSAIESGLTEIIKKKLVLYEK